MAANCIKNPVFSQIRLFLNANFNQIRLGLIWIESPGCSSEGH